ncbi:tRNA (guanosine(37)-N1)-methyltransferase TrmD [Paeniglutamicibacter antarcticus]|uniref:tRNA (guanine-N(1)-)-methyltransferase n=1 Tax=Arthrobacter terrae TaxID=2935737 RepID=A0A931CQF9_9MICC|nr:tRNA (guanosine(37)-N1)-methyltransferase TrmD [Arthrobacter terrae]MBG0739126.1 tRNA (guanosine(37)-N1)-methyltransferase TrmD [Arthrobacter terrae]
MRIDVFSIFPEYLAPLELSLIGKARQDGILDLQVHNLRDFTTDRHRTVDDSPYGGGAGMVMKPEPWALALESVLPAVGQGTPRRPARTPSDSLAPAKPILIVPSPAGEVFDQALAYELAEEKHLVFACGRYEGIDERVLEWAAGTGSTGTGSDGIDPTSTGSDGPFRVRAVSLGDYVLNGGEVAVLAMVEAIGRLLPGVVGNPESLVEESHADGLLEYPVYTKPSSWRGRGIPDVLLSGNHAKIAGFRREEQLRRTVERRPDLIDALDPTILTKAELATLGGLGYAVVGGRLRRAY